MTWCIVESFREKVVSIPTTQFHYTTQSHCSEIVLKRRSYPLLAPARCVPLNWLQRHASLLLQRLRQLMMKASHSMLQDLVSNVIISIFSHHRMIDLLLSSWVRASFPSNSGADTYFTLTKWQSWLFQRLDHKVKYHRGWKVFFLCCSLCSLCIARFSNIIYCL